MPDLLDAGLPLPARGVFTTRSGGASGAPWASLNLARHVGDDAGQVAANRAHTLRATGVGRVAFAQQVHGRQVAAVTGPHDAVAGVDALVTCTPDLALAVLAADCLPVLLADPVAGVVAAVHAGRRGLVGGVLQHALQGMADQGADPQRVVAVIGPAACGLCYELPEALADQVAAAVPGSRGTTRAGTPSIDLVAGAEGILRAAGILDVRRVGGCTLEQPDLFFSYRRDGRTGRHAGLVWLE